MAQTLKYLVINMEWKMKHNVSLNMYALCDMIYHLSNNKNNQYGGWCYMSRVTISEQLDLSKQGVLNLIEKAIQMGFLEKDSHTKFLRTTPEWDAVYLCTNGKESLPSVKSEEVKKVDSAVKKVYRGGKESLPNNNIYNNTNNNIYNNRDNFSENEFSDFSSEKNENFDSESKQQKQQKSDSGSFAPATKKLQSQVEPGTNEIIDVYSEWFEFNNRIPPKLSIASRKAAKEIAVYVRSVISQKTADVKEHFVKEKTREFMERMFKKWGDLEPFLQNQTKLEQINSNINNIVKQLSNGKANNSGSKSRQYSISQEEINRIAENVARKHAARQDDR